MMFNFFFRSFCFATYRAYLLLRYCTFLRRGTLEGCYCYCCGYLVAAIHPKGCERVIYLPS